MGTYTGTSIVTFPTVFLIQSSQNRETPTLQVKRDGLIRATEGARTARMNLEERCERRFET
ncbi:low affinity iron permease family protein [Neoroseomonas terrae]|uniref:low affinity iron permease family protein n=1 Tax=Neoroseomonas terrae TaxID=424799 RepID=UPI0038D1FE9E